MQKKPISKEVDDRDLDPGMRALMDVASGKTTSTGGNKCAHVKMDHSSEMLFVAFLKKKSQVPEDGLDFIRECKEVMKKLPGFTQLDGAGQNEKMKEMIKKAHKNVDFEFTARDTLEQNGKLERTITTI